MKLLILGGTVFLGRHIVNEALARGHEVTLFNRGKSNADLFPELETLIGDRDGGLDVLKGRTWDAAIDPSGYVLRVVSDSARLLADAVDHYTFVSSISVYDDFAQPGLNEEAPLGTLDDTSVEEVTGETYGPLKALCEESAEAAMPGRVFTVRPGLIVGPDDPTDRFTYWPVRIARGGNVLAPPAPDALVQVIDVRDLALWIVKIVEQNKVGTYNATGPEKPLTMGKFLEECISTTKSDAQLHWTSATDLAKYEVAPWMGLPLWVPEEMAGMLSVNISQAVADGLTFRPVAETIRDTLAWAKTRPDSHEWRAGLLPEREAEILATVLS